MLGAVIGKKGPGLIPMAAGQIYDAATVTVGTLGNISAAGPNLTVDWTYGQAQSQPQGTYRIVVTLDSDSSVLYDSGWIDGTDTEHTFEAGESLNSEADMTVTVQVLVNGQYAEASLDEGEDTEGVFLQWGSPQCTITAPGSVVDATEITPAWTYSETVRSTAQAYYRMWLYYADSGVLLYDSGWMFGSATSAALPYALIDQSRYVLKVQLKNTNGVVSS
jgi:hypothetical protein